LNPSHGGQYLFCGMVSLPTSDGLNERCDAFRQPASEPTFKEKGMMNGAPVDGATIRGNLGIA